MSPHLTGQRLAIAVVTVSAVALLTACGGNTSSATGAGAGSSTGSDAGSGKTIYFSPPGLAIPAMQGLQKGLEAAAGAQGFKVVAQDAALDATKQNSQLEAVIASGQAAGIWMIAVDPASSSSLVKSAQAKGVPMILNGTPEDYGLSGIQPGLSFDTVDYKAYGTALGQTLGECINDKLGGKAQVIMETSAAGTAGKAEQESAAQAALAATSPGAKIVTSVETNDRSKAQTDIGSALQGNPDANAVMGNTDEGALGALGAFKAAGKDLPCLVNAGGNDEVMAAVKSGEIYGLIALGFQDDMAQSLSALIKMMADPKADGLQLTVPQQVIKANG